MINVHSSDGTRIAVDVAGRGPAVVLVDGAFGSRTFGPNGPLAALLAEHFTVYTYDRRGRGDSGDTAPFTTDREIDDLAAVIKETGETPCVYGISSGAALTLDAANRGLPIRRLAVFEAPFVVDDTRPPVPDSYVAGLRQLVAADRRADAIRLFMRHGVGVPAIFVALMRFMPAWSKLKSVAPTVLYDTAFVIEHQKGTALRADRWASATMPILVTVGEKSPLWMRNAMAQLAAVLPNAEHRVLPKQTHIVKPEALAPPLIDFFRQ